MELVVCFFPHFFGTASTSQATQLVLPRTTQRVQPRVTPARRRIHRAGSDETPRRVRPACQGGKCGGTGREAGGFTRVRKGPVS
jgi:hypothetical protein